VRRKEDGEKRGPFVETTACRFLKKRRPRKKRAERAAHLGRFAWQALGRGRGRQHVRAKVLFRILHHHVVIEAGGSNDNVLRLKYPRSIFMELVCHMWGARH
jgi:hypothetical protein